jgi:valyl-tRNA synthetase
MTDIPKAYEPQEVEKRWYAAWLEAGRFAGAVDPDRRSYCITIPPPNVTGVLTMGHVLNNTIQDILVRRHRQQGRSACWIPGTDHAGIATQTRVERELREEGTNRHELGRERFVERAVQWRDRHGGIILEQLKRLGASCDWDRTVHTLDEDYSRAVLEAFVLLYERGYVYRGKRMVNWCPVSLTALSDEEVTMKTERNRLYEVRYESVDRPGEFLTVATTRPETIMGDTALAVHPGDERYRDWIGTKVWRPFPRAEIPVIADEALDPDFGTGVLKVTPAHDALDFEIGQRHDLPILDVLHDDGTVNDLGGEFAGLDRFEARRATAARLGELGLLGEVREYENNVGYSERADVPIEPRLSEQWFLRYPKVAEAKAAVRDGHIRFHPARWEKTYLHWLDHIQDWCISRQLWWGHRIPVWYRKGGDRKDPANWHVSVGGPADPENWEQDEDVLDTWASSWVWPMGVLGWPDEHAMRERGYDSFYPTDALVTGPDIIFFWVARMIIAGLEFHGPGKTELSAGEIAERIPFRDVYFTGIIRDIDGRKMSKSLGNSPDPLDLIERFGADGLRFGIMGIAPQGQDIRFSEERVAQGRNFCNKLWNACRFRQLSGPVDPEATLASLVGKIDPEHMNDQDHSILSRLVETVRQVDEAYKAFAFAGITQHIYGFFWTDFCDWYVEVAKARVRDPAAGPTVLAVQDVVLRQLLLLLHPFCPFITEELWHRLGFGRAGTVLDDERPHTADEMLEVLADGGIHLDRGAVAAVDEMRETVSRLRSLKADYQLSQDRAVRFVVEESTLTLDGNCEEVFPVLESQAGLAPLETVAESPDGCPAAVTPLGTFYLDVAASVDVEAERERLGREVGKLDRLIESGRRKLSDEKFLTKAPDPVVEGARRQLEENEQKRAELERLLHALA